MNDAGGAETFGVKGSLLAVVEFQGLCRAVMTFVANKVMELEDAMGTTFCTQVTQGVLIAVGILVADICRNCKF